MTLAVSAMIGILFIGLICLQLLGCLVAIHLGHMDIHKNKLPCLLIYKFQNFIAILRDNRLVP